MRFLILWSHFLKKRINNTMRVWRYLYKKRIKTQKKRKKRIKKTHKNAKNAKKRIEEISYLRELFYCVIL